jgi:hypothetical protein
MCTIRCVTIFFYAMDLQDEQTCKFHYYIVTQVSFITNSYSVQTIRHHRLYIYCFGHVILLYGKVCTCLSLS